MILYYICCNNKHMYINYIHFYRMHSNHVLRKQDQLREDLDYEEI